MPTGVPGRGRLLLVCWTLGLPAVVANAVSDMCPKVSMPKYVNAACEKNGVLYVASVGPRCHNARSEQEPVAASGWVGRQALLHQSTDPLPQRTEERAGAVVGWVGGQAALLHQSTDPVLPPISAKSLVPSVRCLLPQRTGVPLVRRTHRRAAGALDAGG